ncbi:MAG: hypothetical protein VB118_11200 [Oscillospiraceae bacterium]|nr:hypothetical protein [Oscillospiraceae bacterium]
MPEYFDLTFFLDKEKAKKEQAEDKFLKLFTFHEGRQEVLNHQYPLFVGKEVYFSVYEYDEVDYIEIGIYLSEFVFTPKNFEKNINRLLQVVDVCFNQINSILFATGIYELTYDYIKGINFYKNVNESVLSKFPILFLKSGHSFSFLPTYNYGCVSCVINKDAQNIYANPTKEIMVDYGLSFKEADKEE